MMQLGVDFSQYGGPLQPNVVAEWKRAGVRYAVAQYSERMGQHLDALKAGGIPAEAYVYLYWGKSPWNQTPQDRTVAALNMAGNRITRLWLDAEDSTHPYREDQLRECVEICQRRGMPTGIYTGRWWWVPNTGDSKAFKDLPLWHAEYIVADNSAAQPQRMPQNFDAFKPYGGWTKPQTWQFQNTCLLAGHSVDLNAREEVMPEPETKTDPPLMAESLAWAVVRWRENRPDLLEAWDKARIAELAAWAAKEGK